MVASDLIFQLHFRTKPNAFTSLVRNNMFTEDAVLVWLTSSCSASQNKTLSQTEVGTEDCAVAHGKEMEQSFHL